MLFSSKTEAYSYALSRLATLGSQLEGNIGRLIELNAVERGVREIKIALENHEQDVSVVIGLLEEIKLTLSPMDQQNIAALQEGLRDSDYRQTRQEKYENPLARRAESEIVIVLLQTPTQAMMTSVGRVSTEIVKLMKDHRPLMKERFNIFFAEASHVIALGAQKKAPTFREVKKLLKANDPTQLAEIMHIHYKMAQVIVRDVKINHAPVRAPVGKLADVIAEIYPYKATDFFKKIIAQGEEGRFFRAYISDKEMYSSPLYTALTNRGRAEYSSYQGLTNQLGLMLGSQKEYEIGLPRHPSTWGPDCKNQAADLNSQYVIDSIENDTIYVSGPSGMTSLLLNQMEILANFEHEDLKKNYLTAIASYIVGGGFHSLHEVIGPAQYALNLVPGYNVQVPEAGKLALPPNYNQFFTQQAAIDHEFNTRRETAWINYLNYFNSNYVPNHLHENTLEVTSNSDSTDLALTVTRLTTHHELFFKPAKTHTTDEKEQPTTSLDNTCADVTSNSDSTDLALTATRLTTNHKRFFRRAKTHTTDEKEQPATNLDDTCADKKTGLD